MKTGRKRGYGQHAVLIWIRLKERYRDHNEQKKDISRTVGRNDGISYGMRRYGKGHRIEGRGVR